MTINAPTKPDASPVCMKPEWLAVVDEAFDKPAGDAAELLRRGACPGCPVWEQCLVFALDNGEHGPWAGTNRKQRAKGRKWHPAENLKAVHPRGSSFKSDR